MPKLLADVPPTPRARWAELQNRVTWMPSPTAGDRLLKRSRTACCIYSAMSALQQLQPLLILSDHGGITIPLAAGRPGTSPSDIPLAALELGSTPSPGGGLSGSCLNSRQALALASERLPVPGRLKLHSSVTRLHDERVPADPGQGDAGTRKRACLFTPAPDPAPARLSASLQPPRHPGRHRRLI